MSIYDNLANSDYVDANQFRQQLAQLSTVQESTDKQVVPQLKKSDLDLPGQAYDELDPADMAAQSLRRNPLDLQEDDVDDYRPQPTEVQTPYDRIVEQRARMILEDTEQQPPQMPQGDQQFTLNKYDSKPDIKKYENYEDPQVQTAQFNKNAPSSQKKRTSTEQTQRAHQDKADGYLIDQRSLQQEDHTGHFGAKDQKPEKAIELRNVKVDQFSTGENENVQESPKLLKNRLDEDSEKISQILAQLQAPMDIGMPKTELEQVHSHMQESMKQMQFKQQPMQPYQQHSEQEQAQFQSSLYDLANKAGRPTLNTSSNGGSIGQELFNAEQEASVTSNYAKNYAHTEIINLAGTDEIKEEQPSQTSDLIAQLNYKNFLHPSDQSAGNSGSKNEYNVELQQPAPLKKTMSLAERAAQAKKNKQQQYQTQNVNFRQQFQPQFEPAPVQLTQQQYQQQEQQRAPKFEQQRPFEPAAMKVPQEKFQPPQYENRPSNLSNKHEDFSTTDKNVKQEKRMQLLKHFDDIPIHQLHKAEGYQVRNLDEEEQERARSKSPGIDEKAQGMDLKDKCFHKNWKIRSNAFKEITRLMATYEPAQKEDQRLDDMYGDNSNPFDVYGPLIDQMIKDSNLTAQYDGLSCLLTYVRLNQGEIRSVVQTCCSLMLDKLHLSKQNFRDITSQIIMVMLQRRQPIVADLLKRFKQNNPKMVQFAFENLLKAFEERHLHLQDANLKLMFKFTAEMLAHNSRELRDLAQNLMAQIYQNCDDDLNTFCANIKVLRPIQLKEIKDILAETGKSSTNDSVKLFLAEVFPAEEQEDRSKSRERIEPVKKMATNAEMDEEQIDLNSILPENFSDLPRLTQIKQKQKKLEELNTELDKLEAKRITVKVKDYSHIYNVTASLLEDPNMLVFIEAIKMVEHLAILMKNNLKKEKAKQFLNLLADKFKESKTAVMTALQSVFDTFFANKCLTTGQFFEILINQIASTHKNPRVRQMVLERISQMIEQEDLQFGIKTALAALKVMKDKLAQIIIKDTNSQVRDQAVFILGQIRIIGEPCKQTEDGQTLLGMVQEVTDKLPQRRQQEIQKRVEECVPMSFNPSQQLLALPRQESQQQFSARNRSGSAKRTAAGYSSNRSKGAQSIQEDSHQSPSITQSEQRLKDNRYQASLSDIIITIKNIGQDRDRLRVSQITQNLESGLQELSNEGIKECKPTIINCLYWLLTQQTNKVNFLEGERQASLKALLLFIKKLYFSERSISTHNLVDGDPKELYQAIASTQICYALLQQDPQSSQSNQLMDAIMSACLVTPLPLQAFINVCKKTIINLEGPCPLLLPNGRALMISHTIYFLTDRMQVLIEKSRKQQYEGDALQSIELRDYEDLRTIVMQLIEQGQFQKNEDQQVLVQALVYLKDRMVNFLRMENDGGDEGETGRFNTQSKQTTQQSPSVPEKDRHIQVLELLESNFEQGLLALKDLVKDEQNGTVKPISFEAKEQIVKYLLKLTVTSYINPQEQQKQAYSLKALLWLRESFIGLEEAFKVTGKVMACYATVVAADRDASIEQYVLNQWTRDLSLRDICDRINATLKFESLPQEIAFPPLLTWLSDVMQRNQDVEMNLDDFRKISGPLSKGIIKDDNQMLTFMDGLVDQFGYSKVRDFMEIQLIHENDLVIKFLDKFDQKYGYLKPVQQQLQLPDQESVNVSLQEPILTDRFASQQTSKLQEKRDQKKTKAELELQETLDEEKKKYEDIMKKLTGMKRGQEERPPTEGLKANAESDLHPPIQRQTNSQRGRDENRPPSSRYGHENPTMSQFNDEDDFHLSTDQQNSMAAFGTALGQQSHKSSLMNLPKVNEERQGYKTADLLGEGLQSKDDVQHSQDDEGFLTQEEAIQRSRQKIRDSVAIQEEKLQRLESSQIKVRQRKDEVNLLNEQRMQLEQEMQRMMQEKTQETNEWKLKFNEIRQEQQTISDSLVEANEQYMNQVEENERLSDQIIEMQKNHREFLQKYKHLEEQLQSSRLEVAEQKQRLIEESAKNDALMQSSKTSQSFQVIEEKQLKMIENAFESSESVIGVKKIQELLLEQEGSVNLAKPLSAHYQRLRAKNDRMQMLGALKEALENEDILYAISIESYKALLNFLLKVFSFEKELIERESLERTHEREQQNELTQESQRLISKLLNSKEFTTSLIALIQLLKTDAMPDDFETNLSIQDRHYIRVLMRCISRITKALHSESPDLIRAFDVLVEMQKLFIKHPPEQLRQDLPCLADFDYVYRGLKDVSDKMMELHPQKCSSFLEFCSKDIRNSASSEGPIQVNAFIKYLSNMMQQKQY